jgi:ketosteroid isomerase-like protein
MKKQFILFVVAILSTSPICLAQVSPSKAGKSAAKEMEIIDLEKSAWEAYKSKQADAYRKLMSKDYYATYAEGIKTLDREVADMEKTDLRDYSFADSKVVFPSADVAVMTYKVTMEETSAGQDASGTYNSASVWNKRGGKWLGVFHTEIKAQ